MAKNTFEKAVDLLVMAPHKHMDYNGNNPHGKPLSNYLLLPRIRLALPLVFAFGIAAHAGNDNEVAQKSVGIAALAFAAVHVSANLRSRTSPLKNLYFDTAPKTSKPPATPEIASHILLEYNQARRSMVIDAAITATTIGVVANPIVAGFFAPMLAEQAFRAWRAHQVLKGNWAVDTEAPEKEEKKAQAPASGKLAYQPL